MESILTSIKKLLGIPEDIKDFDDDLIIYINTIFSSVNQMGIGPSKTYRITGSSEKWTDFDSRADMEDFKSYMYLKVKMLFDPPANAQLMESYNNIINELEYRVHQLWDRYMTSDEESIKSWVNDNANL